MDAGALAAVVGAAAVVGGAVAGPLAVHLTTRRQREGQAALQAAQTEQVRQAVYTQLTQDLRAELDRVTGELRDARQSLAATSAEAERLRLRVVNLESRVAAGRHLVNELDTARAQLAEKDAVIGALRGHVASLQQDLARLNGAR